MTQPFLSARPSVPQTNPQAAKAAKAQSPLSRSSSGVKRDGSPSGKRAASRPRYPIKGSSSGSSAVANASPVRRANANSKPAAAEAAVRAASGVSPASHSNPSRASPFKTAANGQQQQRLSPGGRLLPGVGQGSKAQAAVPPLRGSIFKAPADDARPPVVRQLSLQQSFFSVDAATSSAAALPPPLRASSCDSTPRRSLADAQRPPLPPGTTAAAAATPLRRPPLPPSPMRAPGSNPGSPAPLCLERPPLKPPSAVRRSSDLFGDGPSSSAPTSKAAIGGSQRAGNPPSEQLAGSSQPQSNNGKALRIIPMKLQRASVGSIPAARARATPSPTHAAAAAAASPAASIGSTAAATPGAAFPPSAQAAAAATPGSDSSSIGAGAKSAVRGGWSPNDRLTATGALSNVAKSLRQAQGTATRDAQQPRSSAAAAKAPPSAAIPSSRAHPVSVSAFSNDRMPTTTKVAAAADAAITAARAVPILPLGFLRNDFDQRWAPEVNFIEPESSRTSFGAPTERSASPFTDALCHTTNGSAGTWQEDKSSKASAWANHGSFRGIKTELDASVDIVAAGSNLAGIDAGKAYRRYDAHNYMYFLCIGLSLS